MLKKEKKRFSSSSKAEDGDYEPWAGCLLSDKTIFSLKVSLCGQQLDCGSGNLGFISPLPPTACVSLCCCPVQLKSEFSWFERLSVLAFGPKHPSGAVSFWPPAEFLGLQRTLEGLQGLGGRRCSRGLLFPPTVSNLSLQLLCLFPGHSMLDMILGFHVFVGLYRDLAGTNSLPWQRKVHPQLPVKKTEHLWDCRT